MPHVGVLGVWLGNTCGVCMCVYAVCVVRWLRTGSVGHVMCADVSVQCVCLYMRCVWYVCGEW